MRITVKLFALLREGVGQREMEMEVSEGTTAAQVLQGLVAQHPRLAGSAEACLFAVNQEFVEGETVLKAGDEMALIPPVSGGAAYEITEEEISAAEVARLVEDEANGAVVTFIGVVRRFSRGKRVRFLEYEAYKEMAEKKMAEIGEEIRVRWGLDRVAICHRVGHLEVGTTSVVIVVGAPHRKEAFEACRYAIDRLKRVVPIWKKEVWEDGEIWIGQEEA